MLSCILIALANTQCPVVKNIYRSKDCCANSNDKECIRFGDTYAANCCNSPGATSLNMYKRDITLTESLKYLTDLETNISYVYSHQHEYFNTHVLQVNPSPMPYQWKERKISLPLYFTHNNTTFETAKWLREHDTDGLIVIKDNTLVFEEYYNQWNNRNSLHISYSVVKSFISLLVGTFVDEEKIDIENPIDMYVPELNASGYGGVSIRSILRMASGVKFTEDYGDPDSDINLFGRSFFIGASLDTFVLNMKNELPGGTFRKYVSIDTQVLAMMLQRVGEKSVTEILAERLWSKMQMECDAFFLTDAFNMELALGGLNTCLRDYAKIGMLVLQKGDWFGTPIVSTEWIQESTSWNDDPILQADAIDRGMANTPFGYGYQWWVGYEYVQALGIGLQAVYINPERKIVIAKTAHHREDANGIPELRERLNEEWLSVCSSIAQGII